ncbi:hypothetical protein [Limibacillus sp. MBR-115]|uniref:hypothetical protein n=1 Tax=Limibacillus sp. MBR-115 TaxID=3156465 RepID=UPI00339A484F
MLDDDNRKKNPDKIVQSRGDAVSGIGFRRPLGLGIENDPEDMKTFRAAMAAAGRVPMVMGHPERKADEPDDLLFQSFGAMKEAAGLPPSRKIMPGDAAEALLRKAVDDKEDGADVFNALLRGGDPRALQAQRREREAAKKQAGPQADAKPTLPKPKAAVSDDRPSDKQAADSHPSEALDGRDEEPAPAASEKDRLKQTQTDLVAARTQGREDKVALRDDFQSTARNRNQQANSVEEKQLVDIDDELTVLSRRLAETDPGSDAFLELLQRIGLLRKTKRRVIQGPVDGTSPEQANDADLARERRFGGGFGSMALSDVQFADALNAQNALDTGVYRSSIVQLKKEKAERKKDIRDSEIEAIDDNGGLELEITFREKALETMQQLDHKYTQLLERLGPEGAASPKATMEDLRFIECRSQTMTWIGGMTRAWPEPGSNAFWKRRFIEITNTPEVINRVMDNFTVNPAGKGK